MYDSGCASTAPPALTWFDHISFTRSSPCVNTRFSSARKDAKFALVARQVTEKLSSSLIALPSSSTFVRVYVALEARKIRTKLPDPSVAGGDDDQQAPDRGNSGMQGFVAGNAATPWILWCNHLALSRKICQNNLTARAQYAILEQKLDITNCVSPQLSGRKIGRHYFEPCS